MDGHFKFDIAAHIEATRPKAEELLGSEKAAELLRQLVLDERFLAMVETVEDRTNQCLNDLFELEAEIIDEQIKEFNARNN